MTPKERAAMQQALDTSLRVEQDSEECEGEDGMVMVVPLDAYNDMMASINAMREALAEQGCSFCNNPLFAGTSCPNCGRAVEPDHFAHVRKMVPDHIAASGNMVPDHIAASGKVILTTERAQQIEEALRIKHLLVRFFMRCKTALAGMYLLRRNRNE